uniref:7TM_GPCR_Srx domain-containing protein n=1 Tax=Ascaris lumbricoides TaxID=6252 RepID=A0A0M3HRA4_ASCLU
MVTVARVVQYGNSIKWKIAYARSMWGDIRVQLWHAIGCNCIYVLCFLSVDPNYVDTNSVGLLSSFHLAIAWETVHFMPENTSTTRFN